MDEDKDQVPSSSSSSISLPSNPNPNPKTPKPPPKRFIKSQIPTSLLQNPSLNSAISLLPSNYSFEIHKTLHRIDSSSSSLIALQFPDGLLMYSLPIADIIRSFSSSSADVVRPRRKPNYGCCCVDRLRRPPPSAATSSFHYGHSSSRPVTSSKIPTLYVFVEIKIDPDRLIESIESNFPKSSSLAIAGTVQFIAAVHAAKSVLSEEGYDVTVPQAKPLSAGEVLGCTAPTIPKSKGVDALIFVADGRFHLEAFMIANPGVPAFRYDPFLGVLVLEEYDHKGMKRVRKDAIFRAREAKNWGVILGTLGRQGSTRVLDRVLGLMDDKGLDYTVVLMSEISPARVELFEDSVDAWVQIACPRLSIDWGEGFKRPLLTTFEFEIAMGFVKGWWEREKSSGGCGSCSCNGCGSCDGGDIGGEYPMDYYAQDGGDWNGSYVKKKVTSNGVKLHSIRGGRDVQREVIS
ncbi:uncharacterized protein A4U43_C01F7710 [Asparagus officinalis]|uniref:2-(3-amino-3-carboxypropyl)histidine synthase subunit 1 n=1 Tax=Asparagus officinalis TaxID=4686 RepID=A0A5P1FRG5_ASPOF|nr:diphthamide biosynthesis protein 1 [Asparagus officinalis]ONK79569.1 uncharacterized protein A4U43_C01F7710 [Asparagus officinalis]